MLCFQPSPSPAYLAVRSLKVELKRDSGSSNDAPSGDASSSQKWSQENNTLCDTPKVDYLNVQCLSLMRKSFKKAARSIPGSTAASYSTQFLDIPCQDLAAKTDRKNRLFVLSGHCTKLKKSKTVYGNQGSSASPYTPPR